MKRHPELRDDPQIRMAIRRYVQNPTHPSRIMRHQRHRRMWRNSSATSDTPAKSLYSNCGYLPAATRIFSLWSSVMYKNYSEFACASQLRGRAIRMLIDSSQSGFHAPIGRPRYVCGATK
jgi:hypothetical protein